MKRLPLALVLLIATVFSARPASAQTAVCRDGTPSYNQHRSEACSRHGGVAQSGSGRRTPTSTSPRTRRPTRHTPVHTRRSSTRSGTTRRSSAASRGYYTGPRGGCYTYSASGRKRYVDHAYCR